MLFRLMYLLLCLSLMACSDEQASPAGATDDNPVSTVSSAEFAPGLSWLNVERALTFADMKGKVVVLDFWTYGCINCIHVLADLKKLEEKYGNQLLVIGVHTPKFENEKNLETVRNIIVRYDIEHPVVNDVEYSLAKQYGMRAWPTRVVIDPTGKALGKLTGEGHYELFDDIIAKLLEEHKAIINSNPVPLQLEKEHLASTLLAAPGKIAVSDRYVAISDTLHHRVILADHQGKILQIFGGPEPGSHDGNAADSRFNSPQGLAFTKKGLYVADTGNHLIRYIDLVSASVTTIVGNGKLERFRAGVFNAEHVGLASPWGLAVDDSRLYIAMAGSHQVWVFDAITGTVSIYAGSGDEGIADGDLHTATFSQPSGLSVSGDWLYIADAEASAIRRIDLKNEVVETIVGTGLFDFGDVDGEFQRARLQHVLGVAAYDHNKLYITDTYNHKLKLLDLQNKQVKSLIDNGTIPLNEPGGLAVFGNAILIADTNNHQIVFYDLASGNAKKWPLAFPLTD